MAKNQTVWGIDIGNTSLKALRCRLAEEPGKVEALACDFIEHSKILSQHGTDAAEVLAETLQTFLSRNNTKGDRIAISVSGQSTISRFLPLPPVDPKKIPDVIRYESKQWLPFDMNDVVFDFQPLGKPVQDADDGSFVDATVGMFAIKRDVATKALAPYQAHSVDIDSIQSSPIALYNFMAFDLLPPPDSVPTSDDSPRESLILLCVGTDATDAVFSNGETIWIRNIPLGGHSFTKALTRELQLTSSKAEYLKRNIMTSQDPEEQKRVVTAMRPVFNDMVNEVNRSLEHYQTLNRKATFQKIIALGNAAKLPGLRQFIAQNLGYEVVRLNHFNHLIGDEVIATQLFKDNLHSFAVCYGLAIQQLGISSLKTNLIPREVLFDRIVREKKPWLLIAAAALLLGVTIQFLGVSSAFSRVDSQAYKEAEASANRADSFAKEMRSKADSAVSSYTRVSNIGKNLTSNVDGRITWLELLRAINSALPQSRLGTNLPKPSTGDEVTKMDCIFVENVEAIGVDSLAGWFTPFQENNRYYPSDQECIDASGADKSVPNEGEEAAPPPAFSEQQRFAFVKDGKIGPTGAEPAKVVQIVGYHYHNPADKNEFDKEGGYVYLRQTLLRQLQTGEVDLPPKKVTMRELGISYPVLLSYSSIPVESKIINPALLQGGILPPDVVIDSDLQTQLGLTAAATTGNPRPVAGAAQPQQRTLRAFAQSRNVEPVLTVRRFDFVVQFAWEETPPSKRASAETNEGATN